MDLKLMIGTLCVAMLSGCASAPKNDPLQPYNQTMQGFNDGVDSVSLKPLASAYDQAPNILTLGVRNFFGNLRELPSAALHFAQGRPDRAGNNMGRVLLNSTVGVGGIFDVASSLGVDRSRTDFGETLAVWGIKSGPYLVVPLLGPSTTRDALALPVDWLLDPVTYVDSVGLRNVLLGMRLVDDRAQLLPFDRLVSDMATDRYSFIRDSYLQRRAFGDAQALED